MIGSSPIIYHCPLHPRMRFHPLHRLAVPYKEPRRIVQ